MIWNFCIKRPVLTIVMFLIVAIFGIYGYRSMPLREYPDVDFPIVSVNVVLPGAEPEVIETEIIDVLEEEINTVEGLKSLTSTASEQVATITAEFELWRDIDIATQDVRDRISRARRDLPDDIEEPIVNKLDPDQYAIMWIALVGDERWDPVRLSTYGDQVLRRRLENLKGVGRVQLGGEKIYAVRIVLDPEKLAAHHLTVQDVVQAVQTNNVDIPAGRVESLQREFLVKVKGQFSSPEPMNDIIIAYEQGAPIRLRDVGEAIDSVENDRQVARFTGTETVGLGIVKQSNANTVELARLVRERMRELSEDFPPGLSYKIASDDSEFIQEGINDLLFTIVFTSVLVTLVVFAFLRTAWGTLIVLIAIPTSLFGGLMCMYVLGFSINFLTMLSLILAIGIVVDDAIVVLENTFRHIEEGQDAKPAARVGTTEVAFPAIANTLALAAVFIPVAFTPGLIGRFFYEFGLTVAFTVIASTLTALTLTPMLCSRLLRRSGRHGRLYRLSEALFASSEKGYGKLLAGAMKFRIITVLVAVAAFFLGVMAMRNLSTEFAPSEDRNQFMIAFETPEGATLSQTDMFARNIEKELLSTPEVEHYFIAIGLSRGGGPGKVNDGIVFVRLHPRQEREKAQAQIMQELRGRFSQLPGGRAFVLEPGGPGGMSQAPIQFVLLATEIEELARTQEGLMGWMNSRPEYIGVNTDLKMNKPQVEVTINRDKASEMGITVAEIANSLRYLLGEPDIAEIERESERYEVIPEILGKGSMVPASLRQIYVRSTGGELISLDNLVELRETIGPSEIHHYDRIRSATVSASMPPGVPLGDALKTLESHVTAEFSGVDYALSGEAEDFRESFFNLSITIAFSIVFIYLVLSAQYESFVTPLIILLTLPLALVGAFGALYVLGMSFGIIAFIGLIMLLGMVTKNAILLVDYTNVLVGRGVPYFEATAQAAHTRFRPVMMTTISTVVGISPVALGYGAGGESRAPMGISVFWGLLAATLLTLVVIPVVYTLFAQAARKLKRHETQAEPAGARREA